MYDSWQYRPFPRFGELTITLGRDYWYYVEKTFEVELEEGVFRYIHPGLRTDFASIPPGLRLFIRPRPRFHHAAVLHDDFYRIGDVPREWADKLFRDGLEVDGVNWFERTTMYGGVRAYGWRPWPH